MDCKGLRVVGVCSEARNLEVAETILKFRLHRRGLMLTWARDPDRIWCASVATIGETPIGAALVVGYKKYNPNVGLYVLQRYRRLGIGEKLLNAALRYSKGPVHPWTGDETAYYFYKNYSKTSKYGNMIDFRWESDTISPAA